MSITYRQENGGYAHIIHIKNERWAFKSRTLFNECEDFLIENEIPYSVDYSCELLFIEIKSSRWMIDPIVITKEDVKVSDSKFEDVLLGILDWKIKGTRDEVEENE